MYKLLFACAAAAAPVVAQAPSIDFFTPLTLAKPEATIRATFRDPEGAGDVAMVKLLIHHGISTAGSCYLQVDTLEGTAALRDDSDTAWGRAIQLGTADREANSQCEIDGARSMMTAEDTRVTLTLVIRFKESFSGLRRVWAQVRDQSGLGSGGWIWQGDWIVPASIAPGATSAAVMRGVIVAASGPPRACLRVDGTTAPCYLKQKIERLKITEPAVDFSMSQLPAAMTEPKVYRNGLLLTPGEDYLPNGQVLTFVESSRFGDIIQVEYWTQQ